MFYTKSYDEAEARRKAGELNLRGVLGKVRQPLLVIHGAKDRLFPPAHAERIAREAANATLVIYPDGNHVCNNIAYKYRPLMADWLHEQLSRYPPRFRGRRTLNQGSSKTCGRGPRGRHDRPNQDTLP